MPSPAPKPARRPGHHNAARAPQETARSRGPAKPGAAISLTFKAVTGATWDELAALFESKGCPSYCWCMAWRASREELKHTDHASRKAQLKGRVDDGIPVGILGYLDGKPVAWCSIAPKDTYVRLGGAELPRDVPGALWSIACFFVIRPLRGQAMTRRLIDAAVAHAKACGARAVEAYPVDPDSPSYRFMGRVRTFEKAGFVHTGRAGTRRHVMLREW